MTHTQIRGTREGFTLIEMLIALAIMAFAGAVVGPYLYNYLAKGQDTATKGNLRSIKSAIGQFYMDMGDHPDKLRDLVKKPQGEKFEKKWKEPFLDAKEIPRDGWGNSFQYKKPGESGYPYELYSYGPKGKGGPKDERISAWDR